MRNLRQILENLGWPSHLTDRQIVDELLGRWYASGAKAPLPLTDLEVIARGVYASLAREGNLDALCWSRSAAAPHGTRPTLPEDAVFHAQQTKHERSDLDFRRADRRRSQRAARSELVQINMDYGQSTAQAWLIDVSTDGAAFLMDAINVPVIGQHIEPIVHHRRGVPECLGSGVVVRTEMLSDHLSLVCVELDQPRPSFTA